MCEYLWGGDRERGRKEREINSAYKNVIFIFLDLDISLNMMTSSSIHFTTGDVILFCLGLDDAFPLSFHL